MANLAEEILKDIEARGSLDTYEYAASVGKDHQAVVGVIKSIQAIGDVINCEQRSFNTWSLTEEGKVVMDQGSHEAVVFATVDPKLGTLQADVMKIGSHAKVGFSKAMSNGWLRLDKTAEGGARVYRKVDSINDIVQEKLRAVAKGNTDITEEELKEYKKRKLITNIVTKSYMVTKGANFTTSIEKQDTDLTPDMITSGSWKERIFKGYNFDAMGIPPVRGHLHPLMKVRAQYRQIFLEMGFVEMPTNNYIESSFWNFDALFQPQQHPARDAHDTFFLKVQSSSSSLATVLLKSIDQCMIFTQVIMLPSQRDVHHAPVYPQPPFVTNNKGTKASKDLCFMTSDPCTLAVNGVVMGMTSTDVIKHLSGQEAYQCEDHISDRMARLAGHLLDQQSYYPLYPPHEDVGMDISRALQHCCLQVKPDVLFLPSELRPFTKVVNQTLCINPGRITKGEVGGTFAKLQIPAGPVNDLHTRIGIQILRI